MMSSKMKVVWSMATSRMMKNRHHDVVQLRTLSSSSSSSSNVSDIFSSWNGPPTSNLVPPGQCQLNSEFESLRFVGKEVVSRTSSIFRFQLPDIHRSLQLSTCACILVRATIDGNHIIRPYTPISTNALIGHVDLLIKKYDNGTMSKYLHEEINIDDDTISFQHIPPNVKIQAPFHHKQHIIMIAGGTGITPMIQALHAILGTPTTTTTIPSSMSTTRVTLLYGSQQSDDILGRSLLDRWAQDYNDRLKVIHVLSDEPISSSSSWTGRRGYIDQDLIAEHISSSPNANQMDDDDVMILVCGPPSMYEAICGPRQESDTITGILGKMGCTKDHVYKF